MLEKNYNFGAFSEKKKSGNESDEKSYYYLSVPHKCNGCQSDRGVFMLFSSSPHRFISIWTVILPLYTTTIDLKLSNQVVIEA